MTSAGFEPANLGTKGQHATPRRPIIHFKFKKNKLFLRKHDSAQNQDWITKKIRKSYSNIIIYFKHSKDKILEKVKPSTGQAKKRTEINISLLNHQSTST
jgi:hypothetical protein